MCRLVKRLLEHLPLKNVNIEYGDIGTLKQSHNKYLNFRWLYINLQGLNIESQIELERLSYRFLDADAKTSADRIGVIFYNNLTKMSGLPVLVFGMSGKESVDIRETELGNMGKKFKCIRRFTGGGTVVVDSNSLIVSIIAPHEISNFKSHKQISDWCYNFFFEKNKLVPDGVVVDGDFAVKRGDCYKKFGGNAMAMSKNYFVHHSCLLWNFTESINLLNNPSKQPKYRTNRSHTDFLEPLSQITKLTPDEFLEFLINNTR